MELLDIGMVFAFGEYARDHPALLRNAQTFFGAQLFEIDFLTQANASCLERRPRPTGIAPAPLTEAGRIAQVRGENSPPAQIGLVPAIISTCDDRDRCQAYGQDRSSLPNRGAFPRSSAQPLGNPKEGSIARDILQASYRNWYEGNA